MITVRMDRVLGGILWPAPPGFLGGGCSLGLWKFDLIVVSCSYTTLAHLKSICERTKRLTGTSQEAWSKSSRPFWVPDYPSP
jgi:hypothetical protein